MAHEVFFTMPERELGKVDIVITVYEDNRKRRSAPRSQRRKGKLGELHLSKGGIDWWRKGAKTDNVFKTWGELAKLIDGN